MSVDLALLRSKLGVAMMIDSWDVARHAVLGTTDIYRTTVTPDSTDPSLPASQIPPRIEAILGDAIRPSTAERENGRRPAFLRTASAPEIPRSPALSPLNFDTDFYTLTSECIRDKVISNQQYTGHDQARESSGECVYTNDPNTEERDPTRDGDQEYMMVNKVLDLISSNVCCILQHFLLNVH